MVSATSEEDDRPQLESSHPADPRPASRDPIAGNGSIPLQANGSPTYTHRNTVYPADGNECFRRKVSFQTANIVADRKMLVFGALPEFRWQKSSARSFSIKAHSSRRLGPCTPCPCSVSSVRQVIACMKTLSDRWIPRPAAAAAANQECSKSTHGRHTA